MITLKVFGAAWCPQCPTMKAEAEKLARNYWPQVTYTYYDVDTPGVRLPSLVTSLPYVELRLENKLVFSGGSATAKNMERLLDHSLAQC
jgi:thiol-disulfide isomerase/thioredoxin